MKTTLSLIAVMMLLSEPKAHAMFGHTAEERQRRVFAEHQLSEERQKLDVQQRLVTEQQQRANRWQTTSFILGIVATCTLFIGTAIGSKGRHDAATNE